MSQKRNTCIKFARFNLFQEVITNVMTHMFLIYIHVGISSVPSSTLGGIWTKATELVKSKCCNSTMDS